MNRLLLIVLIVFSVSGFAFAQTDKMAESRDAMRPFQDDKVIINKIEIYPNPAVENVFIKIENSELESIEIELFNIIGNSIRFEYDEITKDNFKINVEEFPPGYYLLVVKDPITRFSQAFKFHKVK